IERDISAEHHDAARGEVAFTQRAEIDHRVAVTQLPEDQCNQTYHKENGQRLHAPERIPQPVPLLALAQHHFPRDYDNGQKRQADRVKIERLLPQLRTLGDKIIRIAKHGVTCAERYDADGNVDQKAPAPIVSVRYPTAQGRTHHRRDQHSKAEQRHGYALPFPREGIQQYPLTAGLQTAARETLDDAEQDQLTQTAS